eukprot:gene1256-1369_t
MSFMVFLCLACLTLALAAPASQSSLANTTSSPNQYDKEDSAVAAAGGGGEGGHRRLQFEDFVINSMREDQSSTSSAKRNSRHQRGGGGGTRTRQHVMQTVVDQIVVEADRYHMWWTGPLENPLVPFTPASWSQPHHPSQSAIFTTTLFLPTHHDDDYHYPTPPRQEEEVVEDEVDQLVKYLLLFLGSARKVFQGDIVIAIDETSLTYPRIHSLLVYYNVTVYALPKGLCAHSTTTTTTTTTSTKKKKMMYCGSSEERVPGRVFQHYFFEKWATWYYPQTTLLITELANVIFQNDPFLFDPPPQTIPSIMSMTGRGSSGSSGSGQGSVQGSGSEGSNYDLAVFQEFTPTMKIQKSIFHKQILIECYGEETWRSYAKKTIITSQAILGSRNGIIIWTHFMTRQLQDAPGRQLVETRCSSSGIDHAFIHWLVYGQRLKPFLRVKVVIQGEGAVNAIGGLQPSSSKIKSNIAGSLDEFWGIWKTTELPHQGSGQGSGSGGSGKVMNWDGTISPVVLQLDHFQEELWSRAKKIINNELQSRYHPIIAGGEGGGGGGGGKKGVIRKDRLMWQALEATQCLLDCQDSPNFL